jgi:hypothetical protein
LNGQIAARAFQKFAQSAKDLGKVGLFSFDAGG